MKRLFLGITVALVVVGVTLSGSHSSLAVTQVDTARFFVNRGLAPVRRAGRNVYEPLLGDHQRGRLADRGAGQLERRPRALRPRLAGNWRPARRAESGNIRAHLIAKGYAWAASSYRANGYVPGTGAEDTYDLLKIFKQVVSKDAKKGNFKRVYLYGVSMGGHVVGHMIEKWRNSFAGALPVCGVMGDNELFDFFQDMYLLAETLVGNTPIVPTPADYYTNPLEGWLVTRPLLGTSYPSDLTTAGLRFKQLIENLSGGDRPVYDEGFVGPSGGAFAFNFGSAVAGPGRENFDTVYQLDTDPALSPEEQQFNNTVIRITASTQDRDRNGIFNQATSSPALTAKFKIPVLTLHTLGELFVPFHMEQVYARRAMAAGTDDLLVQRAIRGRAHCEFLPAELTTAFDDLVNWVVNDVKPEGDDILDPATVAAPDFGCKFTPVAHPLVPPCQ